MNCDDGLEKALTDLTDLQQSVALTANHSKPSRIAEQEDGQENTAKSMTSL